jgi:hypothetical protein
MRNLVATSLLLVPVLLGMTKGSARADRQEPGPDEVGIYFSGVKMPLNRIIMLRKDGRYCALKFISAWSELDEERLQKLAKDIRQGGVIADSAREAATKKYAKYESYYSRNGAPINGDKDLVRKEGTASLLPLRGPFRPFVYQPGNGCVECSGIKLLWSYKTGVSFIPLGKGSDEKDYGIELAPTPWTRIEDVNAKDLRVKWYRYDAKRVATFIAVEELWKPNR